MARVPLREELKKAIVALSPKEKDKLLFRLIALKPDLAAQLEYQLLEGGETQDERRRDVELTLERRIERYKYHSPGYLMLLLRDLSSEISRHVKTTKDKYGDVYLNFKMLALALERFGSECAKANSAKQETLNTYILRRAVRILKQMIKLDSDYHLDFRPMRNQIGQVLFQNQVFMKSALYAGFDMDWLLSSEPTPGSLKP